MLHGGGGGILSAMFFSISLCFGQCQILKKGGGKGRNRGKGREVRQGGEEGGRKRGSEKTGRNSVSALLSRIRSL